ncbi:MAG: hypothetical protein ACRYG7_20180 [Janthinobacterium lividum]
MRERILILAALDRPALGAVRHLPGVQVAQTATQLWLRGLPATGELPLAVRTLPATAAYGLDAQGRLFAAGHLTPTAHLPDLTWQPIQEFEPLELPTAALPAQGALPYQLRLLPSTRAKVGAALLTTLDAWQHYAETAPESRLHGLRFAVSAETRVLLLGTPLPPIASQEYWQQDSLLLPAGFDLEAPLLGPLLVRKLNSAADSLVLFDPDGRWERVSLANLLPATRSAVRLTIASFRHA